MYSFNKHVFGAYYKARHSTKCWGYKDRLNITPAFKELTTTCEGKWQIHD